MKLVSTLFFAFASAAMAVTPIIGEIKFGGHVSYPTETWVDFELPGYVATTKGDFSAIDKNSFAYLADFTYGPEGNLEIPTVEPAWVFEDGGTTWGFTLHTLTYNKIKGSRRELEGTGIIYMTGKADTPGTFSLTFSSVGTSSAHSPWQAEIKASGVPEPTGALLVGLVGLGLVLNRRR